jgi:hypothetical protein
LNSKSIAILCGGVFGEVAIADRGRIEIGLSHVLAQGKDQEFHGSR